MADAKASLVIRVKTLGESRLTKLAAQMKRLDEQVTRYGNKLSASLDRTDGKWRKHFDMFDKSIRMMGMGMIKFVSMSAKFATAQVAGLGVAMMAVHAAFVLGNGVMKLFRGAAQLAAGAAAGLTIALATAAAAMREQQAAMFAYKGKGKNEFGSGLNQIRVELRGLVTDASLAAVGSENLVAAFSAINKKGTFNQGTQALFKGLMDFASAGQDIKTGSKAAGDLVATLSDPKANFSQITEAAKALGPEMEKALEEAKKKGVDTAAELKEAILNGELAVLGGVAGQFNAFNSTLINQGKAAFSMFKELFADMGQPFLEPVKKELQESVIAIRSAFTRVTGDITQFGQGTFIENISVVVEKVANFFADMIHDYLPKVDGMFSRMGEWWRDFKEGWNKILDTLRPLIDAAEVLEDMFMEILTPLGNAFGESFKTTRDLIVENRDEFIKFGGAIGRFINSFSQFASDLREIFIEALPFLTKIVDGAKVLFDTFTGILGVFRQLTGGLGDFGPFALIGLLRSMGTGMKNARGGQLFTPKVMNVDAGVVNLRQGTALQNQLGNAQVRQAAGGGAGAQVAQVATTQQGKLVQTAFGPAMKMPNGQMFNGYGMPIATAGAVGAGGSSRSSAAGAAGTALAATGAGGRGGFLRGLQGRYNDYKIRNLTHEDAQVAMLQNGQFPGMGKIDPQTGQPWTEANARAHLRQPRSSRFTAVNMFKNASQGARNARAGRLGTRIFGGEYGGKEYKGFNKSAGGMAAASLGLGMLSNSGIFGQEAQGALALGSTVGMINPMAGLAVGLGGAALTATNAGTGALAGAGAGAAIGTMIAPGVGTAVGAVIGGLAGGISGMLGRDRKLKKEARKAAERTMEDFQKSLIEGLDDSIQKIGADGPGKVAERSRQAFETYQSTLSKQSNDLVDLLSGDRNDDDLRAALDKMRAEDNPLLAGISDADFEAMKKKPEDAINSLIAKSGEFAQAATFVSDSFDTKLQSAMDMLGMTDQQVLDLAETTNTNLYDAFQSAEDMFKQLAEGMTRTFDDMNRVAGQAMSEIQGMFAKPVEMSKATLAFDENMRNLRDRIDAGAIVGEEGKLQVLESLSQMIPQLTQAKGSAWAGNLEFARLFNLQDGALYSQQGGPLEGQQQLLKDLGLEQIINDAVRVSLETSGKAVQDVVVSNLMTFGQTLGQGQAQLINQAVQSGALDENEINKIMTYIQSTDLSDASARETLLNNIEGFINAGQDSSKRIELTMQAIEIPLDKAATDLSNAGTQIQSAAQLIITEFGNDTKSPRALGDTGSNLSNTLMSHNALSSSIPGKRTVTSSYRNFALGSLKSDHLTGNALDLVGDNLVSYRDKVQKSGGFAEFHGGLGSGRHLHVVPSIRPVGDNGMPVASVETMSTGGSNISVSNTFNISGVEGSKEELAKFIVTKINASIRDAKERS